MVGLQEKETSLLSKKNIAAHLQLLMIALGAIGGKLWVDKKNTALQHNLEVVASWFGPILLHSNKDSHNETMNYQQILLLQEMFSLQVVV